MYGGYMKNYRQNFFLLLSIIFSINFCCQLSAKNNNQSIVILNGKEALVYFNDGDTFKVLDGEYKNKRARINGFNTLENYGPVHSFKNASQNFLYENSQAASQHARAGRWNCSLDGNNDTYGRLLVTCDDLALSLIKNGFAHAFSMDVSSAKASYIAMQKEAISKNMGMWKFGAPEYIITSLHSADENSSKKSRLKETYNRAISTLDGHTKEWKHQEVYKTCENVCFETTGSCMVYVPFMQRYGDHRPSCLLSR